MHKKVKIVEVLILIQIIMLVVLLCFRIQKIEIFNEKFSRGIKVLNLSNIKLDNWDENIEKFSHFYYLQTVNFGDHEIPYTDKATLLKKYPKIKFNVTGIIDIYGQKLSENTTLIDLKDTNITENILDQLKSFPNLKEVDLRNNDIPIDLQLSLVKKYPNVFFNFDIEIAGKKIDSTVTELDLSNTKVNAKELRNLLLRLPKLKFINISNTPISNEEADALNKDFPNTQVVWTVHMGMWSLRTDAEAFSVLIAFFEYTPLTTKDIEVLKYCPKLKALDLGHQQIDDISVIGEYLTDLRVLILADNRITDLSPLSNLKKLHYLELFINYFSDLTPLASCKQLIDLNIAGNFKVGDLTPLLDLPMIERLWVNNCGILQNQYDILRQTYPNAEIVTKGIISTSDGWRTHQRYKELTEMWKKDYNGDYFTKYDKN